MKKLLTILGAVGLMATTGATVVACGPDETKEEKGDFTISPDSKEIKFLESTLLKIKDYTELKDKYEAFEAKVIDADPLKPIVVVMPIDAEKGEFTVNGMLPGKAKIQVEAKAKAKTFAEEDIFKSNIVEITVGKLPIKDIFKDEKKELEAKTDEDAITEVQALVDKNEALKTMLEVKKVEDKSEIKVVASTLGAALVEGEEVFTYTVE